MVNTELLITKIKESGIKKGAIADSLGISYEALKGKLDGKRDFKVTEADTVGKLLHLNRDELVSIFFTNEVY